MALFDLKKMKVGKPVKKSFMGGDVYILPGLNAAQGLQFGADARSVDVEQDDFSLRLAAAHIRARVMDDKGELIFSSLSVDELMVEYRSDLIDELYALVVDVTGDPYGAPGDAEKN